MPHPLSTVLEARNANHIYPFFWQHGEDDAALLREIRAIHQSGIRALCVESRPHEDFCGEGWWQDMSLILSECRRLGMKVWLLDDKHFPSGYANDILAHKDRALRKWEITERHVDVCGPVVQGAVMVPHTHGEGEEEVIAAIACRRADVPGVEALCAPYIDIARDIADGMAYVTLPEGWHRIVFLLKTRRGISPHRLSYVDPLSSASMDAFVEAVYEPHYQHFAAYFGDTFEAFFSDEPCFGNHDGASRLVLGTRHARLPWRDELIEPLREALGEDPLPLLPLLWFPGDRARTARVRIAYMDVITRLYQRNFAGKLGDWCRAHGVEYLGHIIEDGGAHARTGCSAGHFFRSLEGQDYAGIDVVLHQILPGAIDVPTATIASYEVADPTFFAYALAKLGASHAHLDAKKRGRAMCEIYGAYGWAEGVKMMKWLTDHMLVRGINRFVPHAFSPKFPDPDCPPHFYADGHNPQFERFAELMGYMNRASDLLSDGVHVADVAILYHAEAEWSGAAYMPMDQPAKALYDAHVDFDFLFIDYLLERSEAAHGALRVARESFSFLVVPRSDCLPRAAMERIAHCAAAGVRVIYVDAPPSFCPEGEVPRAAVSGDAISVVPLGDLAALVRGQGQADVTLFPPDRHLRAFHYRRGGDIYMLFNEHTSRTVRTRARFRAFEGGTYAVYDAMDNRAWRGVSASGELSIELPPYRSLFLLFGDVGDLDLPPLDARAEVDRCAVPGPFRVSVRAARDAFRPYATWTHLKSITAPDELPRFSGVMRYEFDVAIEALEPGGRYDLDLHACGETAEVFVNGVRVGAQMAPPYRFDITAAVRPGRNACIVDVTNHLGWEMRDRFSSFLLFEPSGLLGPVEVVRMR